MLKWPVLKRRISVSCPLSLSWELLMGRTIDWQSPYFPKIFERYDRADFAQEFLRRSPAYRTQYAAALAGARRPGALRLLARHWGLVFRPRSRA
jgi:hypothetical protein